MPDEPSVQELDCQGMRSQELIPLALPEHNAQERTEHTSSEHQSSEHQSSEHQSNEHQSNEHQSNEHQSNEHQSNEPGYQQSAPPFVIEHRQEDHTGTSFRPSARLILTERVRTSGLWRSLDPDDFKALILLLTFLTPNGWCRPTLPELADAMQVSRPKAKTRFDHLLQTQWRGKPLAERLARPDGLDAYLPGRLLVEHQDLPPELPQAAPLCTPGRDVVVAYSRARYAKTREEVEREIGEMMGWGPPAFAGDDPAVAEGKRQAFQAMTGYGIPKEQALDLLSRFELSAVERQLAWLPQRGAKTPARFLAAAIEGDYEPPLSQRRQAPSVRTDGSGQSSIPTSENTFGENTPGDE